MKHTIEVRWFFNQPLPQIAPMFESIPIAARTDWYAFPCDFRCGTKVREGRLETKLLVENYGEISYGDVTGQLEQWKKWSLEFNETPPTDDQLAVAGWVPVEKQRQLRRFAVRDGVANETETPVNGCDFELTRVTLFGTEWWTVGFEAVGEDDALRDNLQCVLQTVLMADVASLFLAKQSYSYPQWLHEALRSI